MKNRVFVYGTLMTGFANYDKYLKNQVTKAEKAVIRGSLYHLYPLGCPAVVAGTDLIHGEVLELAGNSSGLLAEIDAFEKYYKGSESVLYERIMSPVFLENDRSHVLQLGVYHFVNTDILEQMEKLYLPDGDWRDFVQKYPDCLEMVCP